MGPRPTGVTILAVLTALNGLWYLLAGAIFVGYAVAALFTVRPEWLGGYPGLYGVGLLVIGAILLIVAAGLWSLYEPAWRIAVVANAVALALGIIGGIGTGEWSLLIGIVLPAIILWYLLRADVRAAFERG
jgi:hypothetical protein